MKNQTALNKKIVKMLVITAAFLCPVLAQADSCPVAKDALDHAMREGIGAQWKTGDKLQWYLDYFSNNNKPSQTAANKFTFMQASFENDQLTCYYQWPNEDGKTNHWMTVRLRTTDKVKASWTGKVCQNFEAINCQFTFSDGAVESLPMQPAATPPDGTLQHQTLPAAGGVQTPPSTDGIPTPPPTEGLQTPPTTPVAPGNEQLPKAPGDLVLPPPNP